jgi:hypothetical protein
MSLVIIVASALVIILGVLNYFQDGKISSTIPLGFVLLSLGILYFALANRRPPKE